MSQDSKQYSCIIRFLDDSEPLTVTYQVRRVVCLASLISVAESGINRNLWRHNVVVVVDTAVLIAPNILKWR